MTLRHMRLFAAVVECCSVTEAARKLGVTQPAVSLAIRELEDYYGHKLFDRLKGRLHITEAGHRFMRYARHLVSSFDEMEREIRDWDSFGVLRVGASVTIGSCLLPELTSTFRRLHPDHKVRAVINNSERIEDLTLAGAIDFGLIEGVVHSEYLVSQPFLNDRLLFICPPGHAWEGKVIGPARLVQADFILREEGSASRTILRGLLRMHGLELEPIWESISTQAIVQAVSHGVGISILPERLVVDNRTRGELGTFKVKGISLQRQFSIIYHRHKFLSKTAGTFIDLCRNSR